MSHASPDLPGAHLAVLDAGSCEHWLAWLQGAGDRPDDKEFHGALAHLDDGLAWARYDTGAGRWRQGHEAFPELAPMIAAEPLRELRLFGPTGEVLIWRGPADLCGRLLTDADPGWALDESRILRGERVLADPVQGFTPIADRSGSRQVVPLVIERRDLQARRIRLKVRQYFERDRETGALRIAAARLVELAGGPLSRGA